MLRPLIFLIFTLSPFLSGEEITLIAARRAQSSSPPVIAEPTITLSAGDLATTLYLSPSAYLDVTTNNLTIRLDANDPQQANLPVIAGPATIKLVSISTTNHSLASISIKRINAPNISTPTQTVVIPDDGSGDREVRLESSTDLITWTATQPGLFTSGQTNRFFRVRLIKVPAD